MEAKQESSSVWTQAPSSEGTNPAQVHHYGGTVAQIVYSGDQADRGQQVIYTADGSPYTSVESAEHTLVYIHPADGTQGELASADLPAITDPSTSPLGATDSTVDSEDEEDDEEEDDRDDSDLDDWEPRPAQPFTPQHLWCEECNSANPGVCVKHGPLHPIVNRPVMSRARASLPLILYIDHFLGGVFSKRRIPKRTQFGPVEGPLVPQSELQDMHFQLKSYWTREEPSLHYLWVDLADEDRCNWMMFVRPAENHLEQNLVAYQYGSDIFYTTIKNIQPKQELKVWYAASYAEFVNKKIHDITEEERKALREQEKNWPCYECSRRFMSSEQLQQHLNMHDDKLDLVQRPRGRGRGRGRKRFGAGRRPGRRPKFIRLEAPAESADKTPVRSEQETAAVRSRVCITVPPCVTRLSNFHLTLHLSRACVRMFVLSHINSSLGLTSLSQNAALQHLFIRKSFRPFRCSQCGKAFREKDKLEQHLRYHGRDTCRHVCHQCNKGFLSSAALEDHLQLHTDQRTYSCLFCTESYDRLDLLKEHVGIHLVNGCFSCPSCKKTFTDFIQVKKHVRSFHSEKIFQCTECDKAFCRPDKLRLHMLRHSDRKDFLCSTCGKQFKRKDKLREHMQRMHNPEREAKKAERTHRAKALKLKEPTTDLESFMFKCRLCMMGFRRRGMLVNHLSKRHPEMRIEEVPELTLPIIKPNRDYFCQYCDKVYKSASKRKAHILKNHPGAELPPSIRKLRPAGPGEPDPMLSTHTQLTGTIATAPVCCPHCAKQYSSKTKMVQHIRKKHPEFAQLASSIQPPLATTVISNAPAVITTDGTTAETVVTTDLLTQAMTELSQTLTSDYRSVQGDFQRIQYIPVTQAGGGLAQTQHIQLQVVQVAPASSPQSQHSTVDMTQLQDAHSFTQHSIQVQHIQVSEATPTAQVTGQPLSPSSQQTSQELSPAQLTPVTLAQSQTLQSSTNQAQGTVQHYPCYNGYSMMTLPHAQYVLAETGTPVAAAVNSGQVKTTHYVISEGQAELDGKQVSAPPTTAQVNSDPLEQPSTNQQATTQYIITTTTNGAGNSEVHITKP
uniref:PR domain zinc finger protein 10 n=1 Tax=Electrophorus electricus TaxID=8005 RepID=A0A4W4GPH3_ELEEL